MMANEPTRFVEVLTYPEHPHVVVVQLTRPPLNLFNPDDYETLASTLQRLAEEPDVRCVILTGAGERCFCGGSNVKNYGDRTAQEGLRISKIIHKTFEVARSFPLPLICAVNGAAVGSGFMLATAGDVIVAVEHATFALPEINVGIMGGPSYALRLLPEKIARFMVLTGRPVTAQVMEQYGAINAVVASTELLATAFGIADEIAAKSPTGTRFMKEAMRLGEGLAADPAFRIEQLFTAVALDLPHTREASRAKREKRPPVFE